MLAIANKHWIQVLAAALLLSAAAAGCTASGSDADTQKDQADQFQKHLEAQKGVVIVDFWATWCGPCRSMKPIFKKLAGEYKGQAEFLEVDIDTNRELASRYQVSSIPLFVAFKDGKVAARRVGMMPESEFRAWIKQQLQ